MQIKSLASFPRKRESMWNCKMEIFSLEGREYIELNNLLKVVGLVESGGLAKILISEGLVSVDGKTELRKRCKIRAGQQVDFQDAQIKVEE